MNPESKEYWHTFNPDFLSCAASDDEGGGNYDVSNYFDTLYEKYNDSKTYTAYKMMRSVVISECIANDISSDTYITHMDNGALLGIEATSHAGVAVSDQLLGQEMELLMRNLGNRISIDSTNPPMADLAFYLCEYAEQGADMLRPQYDDIVNYLCQNSYDKSGFMRLGLGYVMHNYTDACNERFRLFSTFITDQMDTSFDTDPHAINARIAEYFRSLE